VSQQNVEIARDCNAAFRRGDWKTLAAHMDPGVLIRTDPRWPEQYVFGLEAALAWWRGLRESGGAEVTIDELADLGDRVLVRLRWALRGQLSGIEGEQLGSMIYTFRDGRVILEEWFLDHDDALNAVGLKE
jgi:ketosteroid isomerase-like protein